MNVKFSAEINNEEDYLRFIIENNYVSLPILREGEYMMVDDARLLAIDFNPIKPCTATLVAYPYGDNREVTFRMINIKYKE